MSKNLPDILRVAVDEILGVTGVYAGQTFTGGLTAAIPLRQTQNEALKACQDFLNSNRTDKEKQSGYIEIPTGVGKTGIFVALVREVHAEARKRDETMRTVIIAPTTELLTQTRDEFLKYAPELEEQVGLYGGLDRELDKPVTIITYDSWSLLTESGQLNQTNVDLLISDEAHRGTSERRAEKFFQSYGNGTMQLAFTATAHFDEEKSVEQTHKNKIFEKSLPDTVRGGELAEYIHSQLYVIRVAPRPKDEQANTSDAPKKSGMLFSPNTLRKQAAWNQRVCQIYRDGKDYITNDPLSDNQAAFFTGGITQADALETMLNADPVLAAKAKEKGCLGVAVAIHSDISPRQQRQRFRDFKAGKYMAVTGDQKFKEGFDHKPLKVIIDYQRGSLVDKAQILGRGARQWFNADKGRYEGMTFIDTVVYVGSDKEKEDKAARAAALRNAILASNILEETEIFSATYKRPEHKKASDAKERIFSDFDEVEEYATLEDMHAIHAQITALRRDNTMELTEQMRADLHALLKRKELGSESVYRLLDEDIARTMRPLTVNGWIHYKPKRVAVDQWEAVTAAAIAAPEPEARREITPEDRVWLDTAMREKDMGARAIHNQLGESWPKGLTENNINTWRTGDVRSARISHWNAIKQVLEAAPVVRLKTLTPEEKADFAKEIAHKNFGEMKLIYALGDDVPAGFTHQIIRGWYRGNVTVVRQDWWDAVQRVLAEVEPVKTLTKADNDWLKERHAACLTEASPIGDRVAAQGIEIKRSNLSRVLSGRAKTINLDLWLALQKVFETSEEIRRLTDADRAWLKEQTARTCITGSLLPGLMQKYGIKIPEGFDPSLFDKWRSGNNKRLPVTHWQAVRAVLEKAPDESRRVITEEDRVWLENAVATKMGPADILRALGDKGKGMTVALIHHWFKGTQSSAKVSEWNAVKQVLDKAPLAAAKHAISETERVWLETEMGKRGLTPPEIMRRLGDKAQLITKGTLYGVLDSKTKVMPEEAWQSIKGIIEAIAEKPRKTLSATDRLWLKAQMDERGMFLKDVVVAVGDTPVKGTILRWLNGTATSADQAEWDKVTGVIAAYTPLNRDHIKMLKRMQEASPDLGEAFSAAGQKLPESLGNPQTLARIFKGWAKALPQADIEAIQTVYTAKFAAEPP